MGALKSFKNDFKAKKFFFFFPGNFFFFDLEIFSFFSKNPNFLASNLENTPVNMQISPPKKIFAINIYFDFEEKMSRSALSRAQKKKKKKRGGFFFKKKKKKKKKKS